MNIKKTLILLILLAVCGRTFGYNHFNQMEEDFCHKGVCYGLKSITIPGSVTSIGKQAFWGCRTLSQINVPKGSKERFKSMLPEKLWNMIYE